MSEQSLNESLPLQQSSLPDNATHSFWDTPAGQQVASKMPGLLEKLIDAQTRKQQGATKGTLIWIATIIFILTGSVTYLARGGHISSDAVSFLFGAIIGAAFTFMRDFLGK